MTKQLQKYFRRRKGELKRPVFEDTIVEYKTPLPTAMLIGIWMIWIALFLVVVLLIVCAVLEVAGMIWGDEWVTYWLADFIYDINL